MEPVPVLLEELPRECREGVTDNGEPGTNDSFNITVDAGPTEGAGENLRSGNIQIDQ